MSGSSGIAYSIRIAGTQCPMVIDIDDDVDLLTEQIHVVKELGNKDEPDQGEIYTVSIGWGAVLAGRLPRLMHYSSLGMLAEPDERRFQSLCEQLRGLSELIERFGLVRPSFAPNRPHVRA